MSCKRNMSESAHSNGCHRTASFLLYRRHFKFPSDRIRTWNPPPQAAMLSNVKFWTGILDYRTWNVPHRTRMVRKFIGNQDRERIFSENENIICFRGRDHKGTRKPSSPRVGTKLCKSRRSRRLISRYLIWRETIVAMYSGMTVSAKGNTLCAIPRYCVVPSHPLSKWTQQSDCRHDESLESASHGILLHLHTEMFLMLALYLHAALPRAHPGSSITKYGYNITHTTIWRVFLLLFPASTSNFITFSVDSPRKRCKFLATRFAWNIRKWWVFKADLSFDPDLFLYPHILVQSSVLWTRTTRTSEIIPRASVSIIFPSLFLHRAADTNRKHFPGKTHYSIDLFSPRSRAWWSDCVSFSGTPSVAVDLAQPRNSGTALTLSLPRVINFNLSCSLTRNRTSHSMKNLAFHGLLRWKMILLTNSHYITKHFSLGGWENVLLELGSERVKLYTSNWKGSSATPIQTKRTFPWKDTFLHGFIWSSLMIGRLREATQKNSPSSVLVRGEP